MESISVAIVGRPNVEKCLFNRLAGQFPLSMTVGVTRDVVVAVLLKGMC